MPNKVKETRKEKSNQPIKAKDIIDKIAQSKCDLPSDEALRELRIIFSHNDSLPRHSMLRVSVPKAIELLHSYGYKCGTRKFMRLCELLGRKSYLHAK